MPKFKVKYTEQLCKEVVVEAESIDDAERCAVTLYDTEQVILSAEDFVGVDIDLEEVTDTSEIEKLPTYKN